MFDRSSLICETSIKINEFILYCLRFALPLQAKRQDMDKQQNRNQAHLPYRIIALDLDGTLTNHDKVITPKTREVLLKAQHEGAIVVLASGRPTYGIVPLANELKLDTHGGFILAYNGGKIVDWAHSRNASHSTCRHLPSPSSTNTPSGRDMLCWATPETRS